MAKETVRILGLTEFQIALREAAARQPEAMRKANTEIAKVVAGDARQFAVGTGRQQAHFARFIVGRGTSTAASVGLRSSQANAAFWGAKRHTGWYANKPGPPQFKPWVKNDWVVGGPGGPYAINPAVVHEKATIIHSYEQMIGEMARKAFPT